MSTEEETDWIFTFGLTERCQYSSIESSSSIELTTESNENQKTRYVTGFLSRLKLPPRKKLGIRQNVKQRYSQIS